MRLKNNFLSYVVLFSFLFSLIIISSCKEDSTDPSKDKGTVTGKVTDKNNNPVASVTVSIGTLQALTDNQGNYTINNAPIGDVILVTFNKNGWVTTQKIAKVEKAKTTTLNVVLVEKGVPGSIEHAKGGTITTSEGAKVTFEANSFVYENGTPFNGTATVYVTYFDPSTPYYQNTFPGRFEGLRTNGTTVPFVSYGFMDIEAYDGTKKLKMANAKEAELVYPIPASMRASAPETIPLWYYDTGSGKWIEDGEAVKVGDTYVGTVTHLTAWNVDHPWVTSDEAYVKGKITLINGNVPINASHARGVCADSIDNGVWVDVNTGEYVLTLPALNTCTIFGQFQLQYFCKPIQVNMPKKGDTIVAPDMVIDLDTNNYVLLKGRVVDGNNNPINSVPVYLCPEQDWGNIYYIIATTTNANGVFEFRVPPYSKFSIYTIALLKVVGPIITQEGTPGSTVDMGDIKVQ